jgi:hypothetical protein
MFTSSGTSDVTLTITHSALSCLTVVVTPSAVAVAVEQVRTEHMFFASDERLSAVRRMILAQTDAARAEALDALLPFQQADFEGIFAAMDGLPVTIRLLDPPLHEFLPHGDEDEVVAQLAEEAGLDAAEVEETIFRLAEVNPMLGFRGCRLAITYPEIGAMQVHNPDLSSSYSRYTTSSPTRHSERCRRTFIDSSLPPNISCSPITETLGTVETLPAKNK